MPRSKRLLATALSVAFATPLITAAVPTVAPASASLLFEGLTLSGPVLGAGDVTADEITVGIKQGNWRSMEPGSTFALYHVPSSAVSVVAGAWTLTLPPTSIPDEYVAPDGQVDFLVEVHDSENDLAAFTTVSAKRIVDSAGVTSDWIAGGAAVPEGWRPLAGAAAPSPAAPTETGAASVPTLGGPDAGTDEAESADATTAAADPPGDLDNVVLELISDPANSAVDEDGNADIGGLVAPPKEADSLTSTAAAPGNCREVTGHRSNIQTTIATSYPVDGDTSALDYSSSMETTSGTAIWGGDVWKESGTETTNDGWGADYAGDTHKRSYRTDVTYGEYVCYNVAGYYTYWVFPIKQPGSAYYYYLSSRPNFTHCAPVYDNITWRRTSGSGSDYTLSYGVKAKSYVGIEMFSRHGYSSSADLKYAVTHGAKRICGSNTSPGQAAKLQEKY